MLTCEACERAPAQTAEPCEAPPEEFRLCFACHQRLLARALRPLEWYNLSKRHGWHQYFLHDDFYDDDGTACQPEDDVESPADFPAPTLALVAPDPGRLLDYTITRWHLPADVAAAWIALPRSEVLNALAGRFGATSNACIRACVLEICAVALRESGAGLVRYAWGEYPMACSLASLAEASAACLPFREGFDQVMAALAVQKGSQKRDAMLSLGYFHSPEVLDWIEREIFEPITESWGNLAAASCVDWPRVERWFELGRPLSLVAIDALAAIVQPQSPFLRAYGPKLHQPPTPERLRQVLSAYAERDKVPRVQQRIGGLLLNVDSLTKRD